MSMYDYGPSLMDQGIGPDDAPPWPPQPRCWSCGAWLPRGSTRTEQGLLYEPERILGSDPDHPGENVCIGWDTHGDVMTTWHFWDCKRCGKSTREDDMYQ